MIEWIFVHERMLTLDVLVHICTWRMLPLVHLHTWMWEDVTLVELFFKFEIWVLIFMIMSSFDEEVNCLPQMTNTQHKSIFFILNYTISYRLFSNGNIMVKLVVMFNFVHEKI